MILTPPQSKLQKMGFPHLAARGVRQEESGKKVDKKVTEASQNYQQLGGRFEYFLFFLLGGVRGARRGGGEGF